jgi:CRISPR-associated endonuclease/helicase Cas3
VNISGEDLGRLPDIKIGADITRRMFDDGSINDIGLYYQRYFHDRQNQMDFPTSNGGTIYDLLSENNQGKAAYCARKDKQGIKPPVLHCAIRTASDEFFVIDKGYTEVIAPYGDANTLLQEFLTENNLPSKHRIIRSLGKYSVSLYQYQLDRLRRNMALDEQGYDGLIILDPGFYDNKFGLNLEGSH